MDAGQTPPAAADRDTLGCSGTVEVPPDVLDDLAAQQEADHRPECNACGARWRPWTFDIARWRRVTPRCRPAAIWRWLCDEVLPHLGLEGRAPGSASRLVGHRLYRVAMPALLSATEWRDVVSERTARVDLPGFPTLEGGVGVPLGGLLADRVKALTKVLDLPASKATPRRLPAPPQLAAEGPPPAYGGVRRIEAGWLRLGDERVLDLGSKQGLAFGTLVDAQGSARSVTPAQLAKVLGYAPGRGEANVYKVIERRRERLRPGLVRAGIEGIGVLQGDAGYTLDPGLRVQPSANVR